MKRFICAIGLSVAIALLLEPAPATRAGRLDKESLHSTGKTIHVKPASVCEVATLKRTRPAWLVRKTSSLR
jgi:hypothetical protein